MVSYKKCEPQNDRKKSRQGATTNDETLVQPDMQECSKIKEASQENLVKETKNEERFAKYKTMKKK